ncbi:DUF3102 domain-containing protein [Desulfosporosinus shakirovi]|uniref:DUF3102 domain-containing protein n=1 Tax=Desulfosporosinus shakirovi TaxID=2885154 RepID=UPI00249ED5F3|nr:DUF3102 domain-containing protein [Desulfosporosinus sp. SRJS8]MCB8815357.1 DUF3102 domain-containing protein [Desulfosporosinus sp. SRJS8]
MNNVVNERTPLVIAAEINMLKDHTHKTVLINSVEIGRRLTEAKALLKHHFIHSSTISTLSRPIFTFVPLPGAPSITMVWDNWVKIRWHR